WAPGRVNLIGDHTDYNGGLALPMAIDRGTSVIMRSTEEGEIRISSRQVQTPDVAVPLADLETFTMPNWARYVAGVLWALEARNRTHGLDILIDGNLPLGSGLSSSASLEVAVAYAAVELLHIDCDSMDIARICRRAENEFVGAPTGSMDQIAVTHARVNEALLFDASESTVLPIPLESILGEYSLLVINTGVTHELAQSEYANRRTECEAAAQLLDVELLSAIPDLDSLAHLTSATHRARVRHVITENERVRAAVDACARGDGSALGRLMTASHQSLRDDYEVSCPELDAAVASALELGASGARMTGGGFGGSAIALVPSHLAPSLAHKLPGDVSAKGFRPPEVFAVHAAGAAHNVSTHSED
ncbi:MAG: hypothetical protein RJB01_1641, partial [Actinomycetota bacterium]